MIHHLSPPMLEAMCRAECRANNRDPDATTYNQATGRYDYPIWRIFEAGVRASWAAGQEWMREHQAGKRSQDDEATLAVADDARLLRSEGSGDRAGDHAHAAGLMTSRPWDIGVGELNAPERQELYDLRRRVADAIEHRSG